MQRILQRSPPHMALTHGPSFRNPDKPPDYAQESRALCELALKYPDPEVNHQTPKTLFASPQAGRKKNLEDESESITYAKLEKLQDNFATRRWERIEEIAKAGDIHEYDVLKANSGGGEMPFSQFSLTSAMTLSQPSASNEPPVTSQQSLLPTTGNGNVVVSDETELHALLLAWPREDHEAYLENFKKLRDHILETNEKNSQNETGKSVSFVDTCFPTKSIYKGLTALHIAIMNEDLETIQILISSPYEANIHIRAKGMFFWPSGLFYGGEYPLSFAVVQNNKDIVQFLLDHGADPFKKDKFGNTVLHICIVYNRLEIFDQIIRFINHVERFEPDKLSRWPAKTKHEKAKQKMKEGLLQSTKVAVVGTNTVARAVPDHDDRVSIREFPVESTSIALAQSSLTVPGLTPSPSAEFVPLKGYSTPTSPVMDRASVDSQTALTSDDMEMSEHRTRVSSNSTLNVLGDRIHVDDHDDDNDDNEVKPRTNRSQSQIALLLRSTFSGTKAPVKKQKSTDPNQQFIEYTRLTRNKTVQSLLGVKNRDQETPLALAGKLGRVRLFQHIMDLLRKPLLEYGGMESSAYPISAIDTYKMDDDNAKSILHLIVYGNFDKNRAMLLELTPIEQLLDEKWNRFVGFVFWWQFIFYMMFAIALTLAVCNIDAFYTDPRGFTAIQVIIVVFMIIVAILEVLDMIHVKPKAYWTERGSKYFFAIQWALIGIILVVGTLRYGAPATLPPDLLANSCGQYCVTERILLAIAAVLVWVHSLFYLRALRQISILVIVIRGMLLGDIVRWLVVYMTVCLGFVLAFANLFDVSPDNPLYDPNVTPNLHSLSKSLISCYKILFGDFNEIGDFTGSWSNSMTAAVFFFYTMMCNLLLLTMLIAALNYTFDFVLAQSKLQANVERAIMILLLERRICMFSYFRELFRSGEQIEDKEEDEEQRYIFVSESADAPVRDDI